ncbi:MAG: ATP-dependent RecD-like DNA helicase [Clostridia bacterium]|nr:ATP-dependent RecD-like DNA helicase [Clostridia bacterium]
MTDRDDLVTLEGEIEDVVFQSDESGYTVCSIEWEREPVTLVGILPGIMVGDAVRVMGQWVNHPTYGKQFKVNYFEKSMPADEGAMLRYLSSRAIRGIGPKLAKRIVDRFGESTFDVMESNPDLLSDVQGISARKAREISASFREQFGVRNIMMFFGGYFGMTTSLRIYKRWGSAAIETVKKNPYILCDEIYGIGFERADAMAAGLGLEKASHERVRAGLHYVLRFNASANGHTYLPREKLVPAAAKLLDVSEERVAEVLADLCGNADLILNAAHADKAVYLPEFFHAESSAASRLVALSRVNLYGSVADRETLIRKIEVEEGITYAAEQKKAIMSALEHPVTVLTGGLGTGKTTIVKAIVNIFSQVGMKVALAAPTGRAAKRMSESTGFDAKTLHRLLEMEYSPDERVRFARSESNPLDYDAIIVDEVSMVDVPLFSAFLKAVRLGTRIVLIGDADQLPSVGAGEVLHDTIESGVFRVCRLSEIFRQKGESAIVSNAHRINRGEIPVPTGKNGDFFMISRDSVAASCQTVVALCRDRLPASYGDQILDRLQVISCTRKGDLGTERLNVLLQAALNPPSPKKREKIFHHVLFREEDKVMQIRNNYDVEWYSAEDETQTGVGVFNGDIGRILAIDSEEETVTVDFDSKIVTYSFDEIGEIEHAFAVTVHKSQGSEYPVVILPVFNPPPMLATRNLLYTAVTRAKKMVILVGNAPSIRRMVENNTVSIRYTGLAEMYRVFKEQN